MADTYIEYQPPTDLIAEFNANIDKFPALLTRAYKRNTSRLLSRWIAALSIEPPPAYFYYPLTWKSEKQRKAFFATDGFGRGIGAERTHTLSHSWKKKIETLDNGGSMTVYNSSPTGLFVYGTFDVERQPMFQAAQGGVPWIDPFEVSSPFFDEAIAVLDATIETIISPTAGVPT